MTSKRRSAKLRKMEVKKVLKQIDRYQIPYTYRYSSGYFIFSFAPNEFSLRLTFKQLPIMRFGIWKHKNRWNYFGECYPYIDKFKPYNTAFEWNSLEDMMNWIKSISNPEFYISELEREYCISDSEYYPSCYQDILKDYKEELYRDSHNGFNPEEYEHNLKTFNELINSLNDKKFPIFWRNGFGFKTLYDVWYYPDDSVTKEEIDELENKLFNCHCFSFQWRLLPDFFKRPYKYKYKINPKLHWLFLNKRKYLKTFNHPDKQ